MYRHIKEEHEKLKQGHTIKIVYTNNYDTYLNRTDKVCSDGRLIKIERANGARVYINPRQIVFFCIIEKFLR